MNTVVLLHLMEERRDKCPELYTLVRSPQIGFYLSNNRARPNRSDFYPGWTQIRLYNALVFDLTGCGPSPDAAANECVAFIDAHMGHIHDTCLASVAGYVNFNFNDLDREYGKCMLRIAASIDERRVVISEIVVFDNERYDVRFAYPDMDDFYLWPFVSMRKMDVLSTELSP